ncbi:pyridoxal 5'-phosphate synthase glutaminase subunit PdxT [Acerihabitans sp. TG2]|uniref:pyridoxal 5'-phosphate synthase glutaminase subunit PdxT n=1 Tax=Acerihabitans sp. TG2 TaxID=3096008 RepID=UPI002B2378A9|nr:pyridoxal 5'-phosphate synthase glutaminase subunit PdxT [Acerihabitans sp. TG2]MEA9391890.1 pyridoxal 5'-phosphate synthase glutaminase subunit PdxT [Acerihabitans sp. TG2]
MKTVGVLALQGDVAEHLQQLQQRHFHAVAVKKPADLTALAALIIPGGESTAMSYLLQIGGLYEPIREFAHHHPVMGTCAGLIMCGARIEGGQHPVIPLGLIDIKVTRNGFGRQVDSFETTLFIAALGKSVPAVFIRAPFIESIGDHVTVLARYENRIVMAEQGNILVCSFHPELTDDTSVLEYFLNKI